MTTKYIVNKDQTHNPGLHHEVHTKECAAKLKIQRFHDLSFCVDCHEALRRAKDIYTDADGCVLCCPECPKG